MNALTRLERIDNLFPEMMRRWARPLQMLDDINVPADIRVDISENDKEYLVSAEIPGAKKEDIRVSIDGNYVSIAADIKKEQKEKHKHTLTKKTYHNSVSRGFTLSNDVDEKTAAAKLKDDVLRLTLPKREGSAARTVKIE